MSEFETEGENINVIVRIKPEEINKELSSIKIKDSSIETKVSSKKKKNIYLIILGKKAQLRKKYLSNVVKIYVIML